MILRFLFILMSLEYILILIVTQKNGLKKNNKQLNI